MHILLSVLVKSLMAKGIFWWVKAIWPHIQIGRGLLFAKWCFQISFFQTCPFGGHFVCISQKYQYGRNFCTICQKTMFITIFRTVIGMLNSFPPLFCYFEISSLHKSKMAATAILENIYFTLFVRKRYVTPPFNVNFLWTSHFWYSFNFEILLIHKSKMAATTIL